jgi:hypothetical protein
MPVTEGNTLEPETSIISANARLVVHFITLCCALLMASRSQNWRLRLLACVVGLQVLVSSAAESGIAQGNILQVIHILQLLGDALALTAIYLLWKENRDRKTSDMALRLAEGGDSSWRGGYTKSVEAAGARNAIAKPVGRSLVKESDP